MKKLIQFAFILSILSSCGEKASKPYKAMIITSALSDSYELTTVEFETLTDFDAVEGSIARIVGNAAFDLNGLNGIIESDNPDDLFVDKGSSVNIDYSVKDGVAIPSNFTSLEMLSIYYHYEKTFQYWQNNLDLTLESYEKSSLYYNPSVSLTDGDTTVEQTPKLNAAFLPGPRDFLLFKTSDYEEVPLNMNYGVIAHEFGHGIFDIAFTGKDPSLYKTSHTVASYELSGLNEGLADYFSWMVTGKVDEFTASLSGVTSERSLPVKFTLKDLDYLYTNEASDVCYGQFYCLGSIVASALFEIAHLDGMDNLTVGELARDSLPLLKNSWESIVDGEEDISPHKIFSLYMNHFLSLLTSQKAESCTIIKKWFNSENFLRDLQC